MLIGAPFNSAGTMRGVARAPRVLRESGLVARIDASGISVQDTGDVSVGSPEPLRDTLTGLLAIESLQETTAGLAESVSRTIAADQMPLVLGGDCGMLVGAMAGALTGNPTAGLIFIDGHEDAWPPLLSDSGEAADCELGLLLGVNQLDPSSVLADGVPVLAGANVAVLGPRDEREISTSGIASIGARVGMFLDASELVHDLASGRAAAQNLVSRGLGWWLHIDLDVLSTAALPAVDYIQPGGLSWGQLKDLVSGAVSTGGCIGVSVCIYNPDLDPDRVGAALVVEFLAALAGDLSQAS
ncbi:MAG: arginase family protein [Candidatus Nanopelagicales bacterium]